MSDEHDDAHDEQDEAGGLRKQYEDEKAKRKQAQDERDQLKRENALLKSGVTGLDDKRTKALLASIDGDVTADAVLEQAVAFGWATKPKEPEQEAAEAAEAFSEAGAGGKSKDSSVITAEDFRGWDQSKQRRFLKDHRPEFEILRDGQSVSGIAFN